MAVALGGPLQCLYIGVCERGVLMWACMCTDVVHVCFDEVWMYSHGRRCFG